MPDITLPPWAPSLRPSQVTAIQSTLQEFEDGKRVVFMEAPTGSGKTLIAEMVRQYTDSRSIYLCNSLSLQHQYMRDFPDASLLMGRTNYSTRDYPHLYGSSFNAVTCGDCTKFKQDGTFHCKWCEPVRDCPYELAKATAARSKQVCSNTYYYLYETNHPGTLRNRDLVVIDECDTLESILMSYVEVYFSSKMITDFSLPIPGKKTVESSWIEWVGDAKSAMKRHLDTLQQPAYNSDVKVIKEWNRSIRANESLGRLADPEFGIESGGWIYTGYRDREVQFKPVKVDRFAEEFLWQHGKRFLLMSATIISAMEMADSLGLLV